MSIYEQKENLDKVQNVDIEDDDWELAVPQCAIDEEECEACQ